MTKKIVIAAGIILIWLIGYRYFDYSMNQPCKPPAKPERVPENAKWYGGCDGGNWIELIYIYDNKYRFKVYRDWDGVLNLDSDFVLENCNELSLTVENWEELISYYFQSDSSVYIAIKNQRNCRLKSVYPVHDGEDS